MESVLRRGRAWAGQVPGWLGERERLGGSLSARWQAIVFGVVCVLLFSRRPDLFLHPQFYAEDGAVWFAQAYNLGWVHSLGLPEGGYLNTLPRLVTGVALWLPLRWAPLLDNVAGLLVQALPVAVLLSRRCRRWGPLPARARMALLYVVLPNADEIHVALTNAQWHLALVQVLIAFGDAPESRWGWLADCALFALCGVSGPFSLLLLVPLLLFWLSLRLRWTLMLTALMGVGALVQLSFLLTVTRIGTQPLGASAVGVLRLLGGQVFLNAMAGSDPNGPTFSLLFLVPLTVFGLFVVYRACRLGPLPLRLFVLFAALAMAGGLHSPLRDPGPYTAWQEMIEHGGSQRYWFFPMLAFVWCALWCARGAERWTRWAGRGVFLGMVFGVTVGWVYEPFLDCDFAGQVARFEQAPVGTRVVFRIPPRHEMVLVKR